MKISLDSTSLHQGYGCYVAVELRTLRRLQLRSLDAVKRNRG